METSDASTFWNHVDDENEGKNNVFTYFKTDIVVWFLILDIAVIDAGICHSADQFFDFLSTVNKELDYVQMEVRGSRDQYSNGGTLYYGVVNKLANEEAKLGTRLTHAQLSFFKAIVSGYSLCRFNKLIMLQSCMIWNHFLEQDVLFQLLVDLFFA